MGKPKSNAVHSVTDPISDKASSSASSLPDVKDESKRTQVKSITKERPKDVVDEIDTSFFVMWVNCTETSSFSPLPGSPLPSDPKDKKNYQNQNGKEEDSVVNGITRKKETNGVGEKKSFLKNIFQRKGSSDVKPDDQETQYDSLKLKTMQDNNVKEEITIIPEASEPSLLLSDQSRGSLCASLPPLLQGRKWILLYRTSKHGITLSTLCRRSLLWPGLSLLVVGDKKGAVFGGLVEAPLIPTDKKYQGTNSTFVFTNKSGQPKIYRPTGANRFYTLCSRECLALGGGGRFALYLDSDLLSGSSAYSETYGNSCLANSQDFEVKEVELWGFVHGSKYDEILALSSMDPCPCRWA